MRYLWGAADNAVVLRASRDVAASNSTAVLQAKAKIDESKLEPISIRNKKKTQDGY